MPSLIDILDGVRLERQDGCLIADAEDGTLITIGEKDGVVCLAVTVYDKDLDDGIDLEYEIQKVN